MALVPAYCSLRFAPTTSFEYDLPRSNILVTDQVQDIAVFIIAGDKTGAFHYGVQLFHIGPGNFNQTCCLPSSFASHRGRRAVFELYGSTR